ncbi:hypothetical protein HETIRDRAFT_107641 [Heterobasidion irregulare TC 32-1]|uniref:Uncharacterized protein n=1 Tax=Heterobasidion irregulare (strain TC 32-1) TaxID=747525 RepID=W4JYS5_HETIT|nr:uncharacterized protein HETIRDRAFT_107641 [Heterobasidion irregulare TC 32-1]ETW78021.1 hypothetical protein HETIRDRAFT_107641 [Heterobasidion irregulare TC 32-1]
MNPHARARRRAAPSEYQSVCAHPQNGRRKSRSHVLSPCRAHPRSRKRASSSKRKRTHTCISILEPFLPRASERALPTHARFPASASASELHASLGLRLPRRATDLAPACHICEDGRRSEADSDATGIIDRLWPRTAYLHPMWSAFLRLYAICHGHGGAKERREDTPLLSRSRRLPVIVNENYRRPHWLDVIEDLSVFHQSKQ